MAYVPPFKRQQREREQAEKEAATPQPVKEAEDEGDIISKELQKEMWEALRRVLTGVVNKVSILNMEACAIEAFRENLVRGKGIFVRAMMRAQHANDEMSQVFSCLVSIINKDIPEVGDLLIKRLITQWRRCYRRKDRRGAIAACKFLAQLVTFRVQDELLIMKLLATYLCSGTPSDEEVDVVAALLRECFKFLEQTNPSAFHMVLDPMRDLVSSGKLTLLAESTLEKLLDDIKAWQLKKNDTPVIPEELDLIDEDEQHTHNLDLDETYDIEPALDNFIFDKEFEENEEKYDAIRLQVLGAELAAAAHGNILDENGEEIALYLEGQEVSEGGNALIPASHRPEEEEPEYVDEDDEDHTAAGPSGGDRSTGLSEDEILKLRKAMYLIMKNSMRAEEVVHKFFKHLPQLQRHEHIAGNLLLEACYREKVYNRFYALIVIRMAAINPRYQKVFAEVFETTYIEKLEDLGQREIDKVGMFFAALLKADAVPWSLFSVIRLTEHNTTASQRILIKALLQGMAEGMGVAKLSAKLHEKSTLKFTQGLFPKDEAQNTRFAANFFEEINVGGLGDELRQWYENQRKRPREE